MLFSHNIIQAISFCAFKADGRARVELSNSDIGSEPEYTANFITTFRRSVEDLDIPGLKATIRLLRKSDEEEFGADACIIFNNGTDCKIGVFEAKWPRLSMPDYRWDKFQGKTTQSHFDSQIFRQRPMFPKIAIWEMFYCEFPLALQPPYMPASGSACVWHDDAYNFASNRIHKSLPWTDSELKWLLMQQQPLIISDVVSAVCECSQGELIPIGGVRKAFGEAPLPRVVLEISYLSDRSVSQEHWTIPDN